MSVCRSEFCGRYLEDACTCARVYRCVLIKFDHIRDDIISSYGMTRNLSSIIGRSVDRFGLLIFSINCFMVSAALYLLISSFFLSFESGSSKKWR